MSHAPKIVGLKNKYLMAEIELLGGWLTKLAQINSKGEEQDILYTRTEIPVEGGKPKVRGGVHVCLPQFGPDERVGEGKLLQHGFGRVLPWSVTSQSESSVTLSLTIDPAAVATLQPTQPGASAYEGLTAKMTYLLQERRCTTTLDIENHGKAVMRVSPGFHPYFQLQSIMSDHVSVDGIEREAFAVGKANPSYDKDLPPHPITFSVGETEKITLENEGLTKVTFWSDNPRAFICVEPTFQGPTFTAASSFPESERLVPGQKMQLAFSISASF